MCIINRRYFTDFQRKRQSIRAIFDDNIPDDEDLFYLAQKLNSSPIKPKIYQWCGYDDFMYEDNVRLKETFENLDYDYTYIEEKGSHEWGFWDKHIQNVLKWMFK